MDKTVKREQLVEVLSRGTLEPRIAVVGCGGAGNNIVNGIYWNCTTNVETVAINTDRKSLDKVEAHKKVLIGTGLTEGCGADGDPELGCYCAQTARDTMAEVMAGSDIVFVVAGMGGGTGTGAAPVVAEVAKDLNAVTFAVALAPFSFETSRQEIAREGIRRLKDVTEKTIVLENDRLMDVAGDMPMSETLRVMERSVLRMVETLTSSITQSFISQLEPEIDEALDEEELFAAEDALNIENIYLV